MKILFLTRKWPPAVGGMETWSAELAAELRQRHALTLHALPGRADGGAPGTMALISFGSRTAISLLTRKGGHAVIQGGDMALWPLVWLARLRNRNATIALAAHGTDVAFANRPGMAGRAYHIYQRLGARLLGTARVIANSQATAALVRTLGYRHVVTVPLGTRADHPPPPAPGDTLLFPGRLVRRKGLSWFVEEVLPHLPEPLTVAVAGTIWDPGEEAALAAPRVSYLGALDQAALTRQMAAARAVILPNIPQPGGHVEGFGLVAVEAAAAGAVVLAARIDGYLDSVIDGETGFLVTPASAPDWIAAITRICETSAEDRAAFTARAQAAVRDRFTWTRVARDLEAAWGEMRR